MPSFLGWLQHQETRLRLQLPPLSSEPGSCPLAGDPPLAEQAVVATPLKSNEIHCVAGLSMCLARRPCSAEPCATSQGTSASLGSGLGSLAGRRLCGGGVGG